jgi:AraC-like DNA-binding protein
MELLMCTDDHPVRDRFDAWVDLVARTLAPVEVSTPDRTAYQGQMTARRYGQVSVASVMSSTCVSRRTPRLINRSDPDAVQVMLVTRGVTGVAQNGNESELRPGDLAIYTTWQPFTMHATADDSGHVAGVTALVPRDRLPVPVRTIEQLTGRPISGREGCGALLANLLSGLASQSAALTGRAAQLACPLTDLLTATLDTVVDQQRVLPSDTVRHALFAQINAFIRCRLGEPGLTPSMIAEAHHISTRTLHRLFESRDDTVTGLIQRSRLDRCRRDLADPGLRHQSIQDIAARWGFRSPAHFNRRFRSATGTTPGHYRRSHLGPS